MSYKHVLRQLKTDGGPFHGQGSRSPRVLSIVRKMSKDFEGIEIGDSRAMLGLLIARFQERPELLIRVVEEPVKMESCDFDWSVPFKAKGPGISFYVSYVEKPGEIWSYLYYSLIPPEC